MKAKVFQEHLEKNIIPFWNQMTDFEKGGFYGYADSDGKPVKDSVKGCILNSRITWFFSNAYTLLKDESLLEEAKHGYDFLKDHCLDKEYGGIINFRDCKNLPPQDYSQDMKFWWPQTEAIIATLYAYQATGNEKYLEMHKQISDWTYAHFPDKEYGEWYGYLHRDGTVAQPAKGNIFKGPFHIPRMMIRSYTLCEEIMKK